MGNKSPDMGIVVNWIVSPLKICQVVTPVPVNGTHFCTMTLRFSLSLHSLLEILVIISRLRCHYFYPTSPSNSRLLLSQQMFSSLPPTQASYPSVFAHAVPSTCMPSFLLFAYPNTTYSLRLSPSLAPLESSVWSRLSTLGFLFSNSTMHI